MAWYYRLHTAIGLSQNGGKAVVHVSQAGYTATE